MTNPPSAEGSAHRPLFPRFPEVATWISHLFITTTPSNRSFCFPVLTIIPVSIPQQARGTRPLPVHEGRAWNLEPRCGLAVPSQCVSPCFKDVQRREEIQHNNLYPRLKQSRLEGPFPMLWYVVKYKKQQQKKTPTEQNRTKKTSRKMDTVCERTITNCKGSGGKNKGGGGKKEKKKVEHILQ